MIDDKRTKLDQAFYVVLRIAVVLACIGAALFVFLFILANLRGANQD